VLTGFFLMINRRKAISQVIGLLTVENGVMLAAIALTTYGNAARRRVRNFLRRAGRGDDSGNSHLPDPRNIRLDGHQHDGSRVPAWPVIIMTG
jgi:hypothetical protein